MLIAVSGIDCAGKSTQIAMLRDYLEKRGHRCEVLWYRPGYSGRLNRARAFVRKVQPSVLPAPGDSEARRAAFARPGVSNAWYMMAVVDTMIEYGLRARWLRRRGVTVIYDRYVDDTLLDLRLRFPEADHAVAERAIRRSASPPDVSLVLLVPWDVMLERMEMKAEPFPDSPEVRSVRYDAYVEIARTAIAIDATGSPLDVHQRVLAAVPRLK